jgi:ABC-type cobalamin/Fe3+-siderophores transport system ATPase subunit
VVSRRVLEVRDLSVRRGPRTVLSDVTFEVAHGEVLAVLGPNGAGKSTLLDALGGLLPAATGTVACSGRVATAMQSPDLARRSALANVELALSWWGVPRGERRARAVAALGAMGAEQLRDRPSTAMSGGERRRVHLARVLATKPDLLLLDEPFAGLDHETRAELLSDTASAVRSSSGGVIVVVHDRAEAWALADRLLVIIDGTVAASGVPQEVLDAPPTAGVARFLGFSGELRQGGTTLLTRPVHVRLDPEGDLSGHVRRVTPLEDGNRIELELPNGRLATVSPERAPAVGDQVRVRVVGGARFPASAVAPEPTGT